MWRVVIRPVADMHHDRSGECMLRLITKSHPHRQANGNEGEAAVHRFIHGVWWILKTHDPDGYEKIEARLKQINGNSKRSLA